MGFVNEINPDRTRQTIDHERNIVLTRKGMYPEYGYTFELIYKGYTVTFQGFSRMKIHGNPKVGEYRQYDMNWEIYRLNMHLDIKVDRKIIMGIIKEALGVWGLNYTTDRASSVTVTFSHDIFEN